MPKLEVAAEELIAGIEPCKDYRPADGSLKATAKEYYAKLQELDSRLKEHGFQLKYCMNFSFMEDWTSVGILGQEYWDERNQDDYDATQEVFYQARTKLNIDGSILVLGMHVQYVEQLGFNEYRDDELEGFEGADYNWDT